MNENAIEARREYLRQWRKNNPDKVKANTERYWNRKAMEAEARKAEAEKTETQPA